MDVQRILLSVEERDKWNRRLETLERSLDGLRTHRRQLERQLKAVRRELAHLGDIAEAMLDPRRLQGVGRGHAAQANRILSR